MNYSFALLIISMIILILVLVRINYDENILLYAAVVCSLIQIIASAYLFISDGKGSEQTTPIIKSE